VKKSILQGDKKGECFLCKAYTNTEKHHIFGASNRKKSETYGLFVHLCHFCHNEPPNGAHFNKETNYYLKSLGQQAAMDYYKWDIDQFRAIFGKNYL
jgi:hypothetical protein